MQLRVTQLEAFRKFMSDVSYVTESDLIETLSGSFLGNEYTRIGTAFHRIVECGDISEHREDKRLIKVDGFEVVLNQSHIDTALSYKEEIRGCFHEIRANKTYHVNGFEIEISGGADVIIGNIIRDIKTKFSGLRSILDYTDSYQWRLYCDIFDIPEFYFDIFEFKGYKLNTNGYDVSNCPMIRHEPIQCLAYKNMTNDIEKLLTQFTEFVRFKNIEHLFTQNILEGQIF